MHAAAAGAMLALPAAGPATAAERIRIGGTGVALGTMQRMADGFTAANPDISVVVLPSLGTIGAIKAVPRGGVEVGLSTRPLTADELKQGVVSFEYARSPLVFAVSVRSKVHAVTLAQLADLYSGKVVAWPDGTQFRPILRQPGEDSVRQMKGMSADLARALSAAEQRPGMPFATSDQEMVEKIESIPGAFGVTTLSQIIAEKRALRALSVDGVEATVNNAAAGKYPHVKRLYLTTRDARSSEVARFVAFVQSRSGRAILAGSGNWVP